MAGFGGSVKLTGETEYRKALQNIKTGLKEVSTEMRLMSAQYQSNDKNVAALNSKSGELAKKLNEQKKALDGLKTTYQQMAAQYEANAKKNEELARKYETEKAKLESIGKTLGTTSKEYQEQAKVVESLEGELKANTQAQDSAAKSLSNMRIQITQAETNIVKAQNSLDGLNEELESTQTDANTASKGIDEVGSSAKGAKGGLDDLGDGADDATKDLNEVGEQADATGKKLEGLKAIAATALKGLGIALMAASAGAVALGKAAIESYADYEQLVGGVDTLFKDGSKQVQEYAANAFKTAGLSANDYMETVTSFSASLIQSLDGDTVKAAKVADMAITDMSDNANKMGTDMASLQNAYQGFAKQNYTMLDNLKLGYGGTKEEMQRLLEDAEKLSGVEYDIKNLSDVYEAIHVIQDELNITGTTAEEAEKTISGSAASMKAAWQNLLTGMADDNADFSGLIETFVDSAVTVANNLIPRIKNVISGLSDLVNGLIKETLPLLLQEIPSLLNELLPALVSSIESALQGAFSVIPQLLPVFQTVIEQLLNSISELAPQAVNMGIELISKLVEGIGSMLPSAADKMSLLIPKLVTSITEGVPQIIKAATVLLGGILQSIPIIAKNIIPQLGDLVVSICDAITQSADILSEAGIELFSVLTDEVLPTMIDLLTNEAPKLIVTVANVLMKSIGKLQTAGTKLFTAILTSFVQFIPVLLKAMPVFMNAVTTELTKPENMNMLLNSALELFLAIGEANAEFVRIFMPEIPKFILGVGEALLAQANYLAKTSLNLFMNILTALKTVGSKIIEEAKKIVTNLGTNLVVPLQNKFSAMKDALKATFNGFADWFRGVFADAWGRVQGVFSNFGSFFSGLFATVRNAFGSLGSTLASAIGGSVKSGLNSVITMIQNTINAGINNINGAINLINKLPNVNVAKIATLNLPRLAKGGIITKETLATLGEHGKKEAIVPLESNTEWITKVASEVSNMIMKPFNANNTPLAANMSYTEMVDAFKEALGEMQVVLDDEEVGTFVKRTVSNAIYT